VKKKSRSQYQLYERYIFSALRKIYGWTKKNKALAAGKIGINQYECAKCKKIFTIKEINVDHITPVMELKGWTGDWTAYIKRLFHGKTQLLCKEHHKEKTTVERKLRSKNKEKAK
jgi:hypothetical protein